MNKFDASYIKYDLQGQLKSKLHDLQVAKKLQQSETSEEFLLGYSKAVSDLGLAVVNWNYPKEKHIIFYVKCNLKMLIVIVKT